MLKVEAQAQPALSVMDSTNGLEEMLEQQIRIAQIGRDRVSRHEGFSRIFRRVYQLLVNVTLHSLCQHSSNNHLVLFSSASN
jgi:hypothetical protein